MLLYKRLTIFFTFLQNTHSYYNYYNHFIFTLKKTLIVIKKTFCDIFFFVFLF